MGNRATRFATRMVGATCLLTLFLYELTEENGHEQLDNAMAPLVSIAWRKAGGHKVCRRWLAPCAFGVCFGMGTLAFGGTVSGTITVTGLKAGAKFAITVYGDDGKEAGEIRISQSGPYSIALPPGRYTVKCTSPPGSKGSGNAGTYVFALDQPNRVNMTLNCG